MHATTFWCVKLFRLEENCEGVLPLDIDIADVETGVIASFSLDGPPGAAGIEGSLKPL